MPEHHETQEKFKKKEIACYVQCWTMYRSTEKGYNSSFQLYENIFFNHFKPFPSEPLRSREEGGGTKTLVRPLKKIHF